jgi:hypothetical protein
VEFGGTVGDILYPPGPPPGTNCTTATFIVHPGTVSGTVTAGSDVWYKLTLSPATHYTITGTPFLAGNPVALSVTTGICPTPLTPVAVATAGTGTGTFTTTTGGVYWIRLSTASGTNPYSFSVSP